jgi:hypothetical protein
MLLNQLDRRENSETSYYTGVKSDIIAGLQVLKQAAVR